MYQNIATKVLTGEVRLSYCNLSEAKPPKADPNGKPKFSVTMLIPKTDVATKADIDASIKAAYEAGVTSKWQGARPQMRSALIYDGDGVRPNGEPFGPECKGHWVITASANADHKPQVVDISNINVTLAPQDVYSGMYARVTISFYPYSNTQKGVGCSLGNVLKTRDGEPLSGGASASSDFAGLGQAPAITPATGVQTNPITGLPM